MQRNSLFNNSFSLEKYNNQDLIKFLLSQIQIAEENLKDNLENIRKDFPNLTDHSLEHSLMLWNYAQLLIGENIELNPIEAYVLHMCFLIHDAGMCFSILNNKDEIEKTEIYKDFIEINKSYENVDEEALFYCVRKLHGDFAERIPQTQLQSGKWVIDNEDLRDELSVIIGKISKSHSCDISYIENELDVYIMPRYVNFPIDCQKLAIILRTSDAAHLDNLRTPLTIKEIDKSITGESKKHWIFQKKLGFPTITNKKLIIKSNQPFKQEEKNAWWLSYEAYKMLDRELKNAEQFFQEKGQPGLVANGVMSIDNTLELGEKYLLVEGWKSVDTSVKVNYPKLVAARLGGKNLYQFTYEALREIIQNSLDAISVRRAKEESFEGKIIVTLFKENNKNFLKIQDNGIGMNINIITNYLLDFGSSYWSTYDFYDEYVGIARLHPEIIGKFGIGFYSIFMLGKKVEIETIKLGDNINISHILKFENGLLENPTLSEKDNSGVNKKFGTSILVELTNDPYIDGFISEFDNKATSTLNLIRFLIPSPGCDIEINENGEKYLHKKNSIDDTKVYTFEEFIDLIFFNRNNDNNTLISMIRDLKLNLIPLIQNNEVIGQLGIIPKVTNLIIQGTNLIISNGIRVSSEGDRLLGYIKSSSVTNLNRNKAEVFITYETLYNWALQSLEYMESKKDLYDFKEQIKGLKFTLGFMDQVDHIALFINGGVASYCDTSFIKSYLMNNQELVTYEFMSSEINNNYKYKGFVSTVRPVNLNSKCSEKGRFIDSFNKYCEDLMRDIWGDFTKSTSTGFNDFPLEVDKFISASLPYFTKNVYTKVSKSLIQ